MLQLILHLYVFLAWTGAWSVHSGIGALFFCLMWFATIGLGLVCAFVAPSIVTVIVSLLVRLGFGKDAGRATLNVVDAADLILNGITFMLPILGVAGGALLLYFMGMGDYLSKNLPRFFPPGGYLFSDTTVPLHAYAVLGYLAWTYYSMLDRFALTDGIKESMPAAKDKVMVFAKGTAQRSVVLWRKYSPIAATRSKLVLDAIKKQGKAFGLLQAGLVRHGGMALGKFALADRRSKSGNDDFSSENEAMITAIQHHIAEHGCRLKGLWRESRVFTVSFWVIVSLIVLFTII